MTAQEEFWNWFHDHEEELFDFDPDRETERERIFDQLTTELQKVDPDLTFEFGPRETRREFVISAGGIKRAFPAVVSLADATPTLNRWKVMAFARVARRVLWSFEARSLIQWMFSSHCLITER